MFIIVLAENFDIDEEYTAKAYGLDRLSEVMNNVIPEAVQKTFVAVQKVNLELKKGRAQAVVATSAVAAAATGAVPIPFSDAAVLVPEQVAMLGGITAVFGIPLGKSNNNRYRERNDRNSWDDGSWENNRCQFG